MKFIDKNVLFIVPQKELFDSFMKNTICKLLLPKGFKYAFLEIIYDQEFDASKLLEKIKSSSFSHYDKGIILFPLEGNFYGFRHNEMPMLNEFLFSKGVKQMSGITVGRNGVLDGVMLINLKNDLIFQ